MTDSNDEDLSHTENENVSTPLRGLDLDKLSIQYGAEYYSLVDEEEQKEIAKRNLEMRDKLKSFNKKNDKNKTTLKTQNFIKIDTQSKLRNDVPIAESIVLKDILGLNKSYNKLKTFKFPYLVMLDIELGKMLEWLSPTIEERKAKQEVLIQLEIVVTALFPKAKVKPFGSYVTGLSLPGADIDVCIEVDGPELEVLNLVVYSLNRLGLVHSFECIYNTNVPIVRVVDKRTGTFSFSSKYEGWWMDFVITVRMSIISLNNGRDIIWSRDGK